MSIGFLSKGGGRGRGWPILAVLLSLTLISAACGDDDGDSESSGGGGDESTTLRLGYFPNVTHAPAIIGIEEGIFEDALGTDVELEVFDFNSGTDVQEALFSDALDASFIGPSPAITAFAESEGEAVRIVSGSTSGGAALVVSEDIQSPEDLRDQTLATPSLGNTQDVALRAWLAEQGFETDTSGGGDVHIAPQENADTLAAFQDGQIAGAWLPEPWSTRLIQEGGGHVLVDEHDLWPDGQFVTTHLIVHPDFLDENPEAVQALTEGLLDAIAFANDNPEEAQQVTNDGIEAITESRLPDEVISAAWENLTFTPDPIASSLEKSKDDAVAAGIIDDVDLADIYDLTTLNELLAERGEEEVEGL